MQTWQELDFGSPCLWSLVLVVGPAASQSLAQTSNDAGPPQPPPCPRRGRIHRMFHHVAHTVQDKFVGYPDTFVEPPLGYYVNEQLSVQVAKANTHRFTFYRSDFLPGTIQFSPRGASRFNVMAGADSRLDGADHGRMDAR